MDVRCDLTFAQRMRLCCRENTYSDGTGVFCADTSAAKAARTMGLNFMAANFEQWIY